MCVCVKLNQICVTIAFSPAVHFISPNVQYTVIRSEFIFFCFLLVSFAYCLYAEQRTPEAYVQILFIHSFLSIHTEGKMLLV
jgi:hypothetical protein